MLHEIPIPMPVPEDLEPMWFPSRADELNAAGTRYHHAGEIEAARLHYLGALYNDPNHPMALQNLGAALLAMERYEAAESVSRRAIAALPGNVHAQSNLAVALLGQRKYSAAEALFREVLVGLPEGETPGILHNFGLTLYMRGKYESALESLDRAVALAPGMLPVESDRGLALLSLGRLQEGLAQYEVRWKMLHKSPIWDLGIPEWAGEDLKGKRILLHHEQGFGDGLMLVRFAKNVAQLGAEVTLAVPEPLVDLFRANFPALRTLEWESEELKSGAYDFHSPFLSVMRWLGISSPGQISPEPYLTAGDLKPGIRLPAATLRVGIVWASGDHGPALTRRRRLVPLAKFLPMSEIPGVKLISLQKGPGVQDMISVGTEGIIFDCMGRVDSFAQSAAIVSELDLVISVDSAMVHLAGAMGKPTLMLSPYTRCWRWWNVNSGSSHRSSSGAPWYNDFHVASQSADGTWDRAMDFALKYVQSHL